MPSRVAVIFLLFLALTASLAAQGPSPGAVQVFPISQLKPGMTGTGYTVFQGEKVESFPVEIIGRLRNQWGPRQDVILARVGGDKLLAMGVAAGMSGSPVYIDGKLVGAISLRFGPFPNEPLAGITPAELIMEINEMDKSREAGATTVKRVPLPSEFRPASPGSSTSSDAFLVPIEMPLVFAGIRPGVLEPFRSAFEELGVRPVAGGMGSALEDGRSITDPKALEQALPPGAAVSAMLITGDLAAGASGTVTYNDGHRVLAFGHSFLNFGEVEMPMAKTEVLTVMGSSFQPTKIANTTQVVGALRQDRHSGILGVLGESARMIPVEVNIRSGKRLDSFHYQVFQNAKYTPLLVTLACFNSLSAINVYGDQGTYRVQGTIQMNGVPDVRLDNLFTNSDTPNAPPPPLGASAWIGDRFTRILNSALETPRISAVKVDFEVAPQRRLATVDQVTSDKTEARPGEQVNLKVYLRPWRGERVVKDVQLTIPMTAPRGDLRIVFSDPDLVNRAGALLANPARPFSLNEIISLLNREYGNGRLYVTVLQASPTGYIEDKVMPQLPASVANVIDPNRSQNRLALTYESTILQQAIPVDYVITGNQSVVVRVK
jgi:hypothetical protein